MADRPQAVVVSGADSGSPVEHAVRARAKHVNTTLAVVRSFTIGVFSSVMVSLCDLSGKH